MKLTNQQALLLLQIAQESIITSHFSMSVQKRQDLVNTLLSQQSKGIVELNTDHVKGPHFGTEISFGDGRTEK